MFGYEIKETVLFI